MGDIQDMKYETNSLEEQLLVLMAIHKEAKIKGDFDTCLAIENQIDKLKNSNVDMKALFDKTDENKKGK